MHDFYLKIPNSVIVTLQFLLIGSNVTIRSDAGQPRDLQVIPHRRVLLYVTVHWIEPAAYRTVSTADAYEASVQS